MLTLGQNFLFGFYEIDAYTRMLAIRRAGFDNTMIWWTGEDEGDDPKVLFDLSQRAGLKVITAHFPTWDSHSLWKQGKEGDRYEKAFLKALKECSERKISHLVMHTTKKLDTPPYNKTGAERMLRLAQAALDENINIAVENTRFLDYNQYLYDNVPLPNMKFCFDSGHANCFTPLQDPLSMFGDRLCTTHLHDNNGAAAGDEHRLPGEGTVDFKDIASRLKALNATCYNLESAYSAYDKEMGMSMEEYLSRSYHILRRIAAEE